jgi:hypothetical protein
MSEADTAVENAISFETKKDAMRQRQNGDWVLALLLQADDLHPRVTAARMGTRYLCTLVELNDDETAVDHKLEDRGKWRDLGPVKQAGIRCADPLFQAFLREQTIYAGVKDEASAADAVRAFCGVLTRTELGQAGNDGKFFWLELDTKFQAWKVLEHG